MEQQSVFVFLLEDYFVRNSYVLTRFAEVLSAIRVGLRAANASRFLPVSVYPPSLVHNENPSKSATSVREKTGRGPKPI